MRMRRHGFTLIEMLVVTLIIGMLAAMLLPAVQAAREAARRTSCTNNMKQLALAFHNYQSAESHLPFSKRVEADGASRSWVPDLLPFLEQSNMVSDVNWDLTEDWFRVKGKYDSSKYVPNGVTAQKFLGVMICPSTTVPHRTQFKYDTAVDNKIGACGDYFAPEGVHSAILNELGGTFPAGTPLPGFPAGTTASSNLVLPGVLRPYGTTSIPSWVSNDARSVAVASQLQYPTLEGVTDGTSNTILIGECAGREDVWRGRAMTPANAVSGDAACARARGGAWATNDGPYPIGQRINWCGGSIPATVPMKINASNEWGFCYYSFHNGGANFAFADGSVHYISDKTPIWVVASLTTRCGGEALSDTDY